MLTLTLRAMPERPSDIQLLFGLSGFLREVQAVLTKVGVRSYIEIVEGADPNPRSRGYSVSPGAPSRLFVPQEDSNLASATYREYLDQLARRDGHPFTEDAQEGATPFICEACKTEFEPAGLSCCPSCGLRFAVPDP
jgi:hypothetical protein